MTERRVFWACLCASALLVGTLALLALDVERDAGDLTVLDGPVARLALGRDALPDPNAVPTPARIEVDQSRPVRLHARELRFHGEGDWTLGAMVIARYAAKLAPCDAVHQEGPGARVALHVVQGEVRSDDPSCFERSAGEWPWPQDLTGVVEFELFHVAAM